MNKNWKAATLAVQAGYEPKDGEPRITPMVQSTTYRYDTTQSVADLFDLKREGFFYSRLANPTVDAMEKKIAALEGGVAAVALSSGQTANTLAIMNIAKAGDHVVASAALYGGTVNLFTVTLPKMGIKVTLVDAEATE
ncbi:MAG: O-acetylhomoserine aminocarboxypropyltransferase/cysteine synthase, partial [Lentisphaeria bacterium]|nr:O-acetylhomoserine aminocarboxypropyltransferase/cysteine synthase [Lentisphaeria bacterium]